MGRRLAEGLVTIDGALAPFGAAMQGDPLAWRGRVDALRAQAAPWVEYASGSQPFR